MNERIRVLTWEATYSAMIGRFLQQVGAPINDYTRARTADLMKQVILDTGYVPSEEK